MQQFSLENDIAYQRWREQKLNDYPKHVEQLIITVKNPYRLTREEKGALLKTIQKTNLVLYKTSYAGEENKKLVTAMAGQLGLVSMDANLCADRNRISSIQVMDEDVGSYYVPYTSKSLNWHTDGYYNQDNQRIRAFLMHCVRPATSGGGNAYLDPEILYILLRDDDPKNVAALMNDKVMTIPANKQSLRPIREEKSGPVLLLDKKTQSLYVRYTARSRNIIWEENDATKQARLRLLELLDSNDYLFRYRLQGGEGVICNNVLHNRSTFTDYPSSRRLLYRARFYERITK